MATSKGFAEGMRMQRPEDFSNAVSCVMTHLQALGPQQHDTL